MSLEGMGLRAPLGRGSKNAMFFVRHAFKRQRLWTRHHR